MIIFTFLMIRILGFNLDKALSLSDESLRIAKSGRIKAKVPLVESHLTRAKILVLRKVKRKQTCDSDQGKGTAGGVTPHPS
jgi:hypothetical protein